MPKVTSDLAYDYIRKRILSGEFPMGQALKTNMLSAAIGVSRTPIRDALRQLEADGLVEIEPHFGASVKSLDINEFKELCMMRLALESMLAGVAAELRTDMDLREIGRALQNMERLHQEILSSSDEKEAGLYPEMTREDINFHVAIMTAARKPRIKKEVLRLRLINRVLTWERTAEVALGISDRATRDGDCRRGFASHQEIYGAIRQGHGGAAKEAMALHIQDIIDSALDRLSGFETKLLKPKELTDVEQLYPDRAAVDWRRPGL